MMALYPVQRHTIIEAMAILMPHGSINHDTVGSFSAVKRELSKPKLLPKSDPKIMAMATIDVTLGIKYATRYQLCPRKPEFSRNAITRARASMGMVEMIQISSVLTIDCQNWGSVTRKAYWLKPTNFIAPMPSHFWKDRYNEKTMGNMPKTANRM